LTHASLSETLAAYAYTLDAVGNRTALTETLVALAEVPAGAHLEQGGLLALEAEHAGRVISDATHAWLTQTVQSGYTGTAYLRAMPDTGRLVASEAVSTAPRVEYPLYVTTPGTYTVWLRGRPAGRRRGRLGLRGTGGAGGGRERPGAGRLDLG
jgi:hypothetical protein